MIRMLRTKKEYLFKTFFFFFLNSKIITYLKNLSLNTQKL